MPTVDDTRRGRAGAGPVRLRLSLEVEVALRRFCPMPGWRHCLPPAVDVRDPDVVTLCEAGLASIGHVNAGNGVPVHDRLLLTVAGFDAADALTRHSPEGERSGGRDGDPA